MVSLQIIFLNIKTMKQQFFFILLAATFLLLFSCKKKEIFSPDKYIETESFQSGTSDPEVIKRFAYSQDNQLTSMWLKEGNTTLTFEYNKDKTISKIISSENKGATYALLSYKDKLVAEIQYYENNQLALESLFYRKDKKNTINKIENYVYGNFSPEKKSVLADLLFAEGKNMPELKRKSHKSGGKSLYSVLNITYEGDNIYRVRLSYVVDGEASLYSASTYTYDGMKNPYYGLPYVLLELTGYSKNNVTHVTTPIENDPLKTLYSIENSYSYEKKYPVYKSVIETVSYITGKDTSGNPVFSTFARYSSYQYSYKWK